MAVLARLALRDLDDVPAPRRFTCACGSSSAGADLSAARRIGSTVLCVWHERTCVYHKHAHFDHIA